MRDGDDEADAAEVVASGFVVARGDRPPVFELAERAFDDVSQSVGNGIVAGRIEAVGFGRDHGLRALGGEEVAHVVGLVGLSPIGRVMAGTLASRARPPTMSCTCPPLSFMARRGDPR